jgi:hypothetical protein
MANGRLPESREALARLAAAQLRWSFVFLLLGILLPLGLRALLERQARRLDALASDGVTAEATVTAIDRRGSSAYTVYEYSVDGTRHTWNVARVEAPFAVGERFAVLCSPAHPGLSRPTTDRARVRAEAAGNRSLTLKLMLGVLIFFGVNAILSFRKFWRLLEAKPGSDAILISPEWLGRVVALLVLGAMLFALNTPSGGAPKAPPAASLVVAFLYLPFFAIFQHLMMIVVQAVRDGRSTSKLGLATFIARAHQLHPELARSRRIVLAGFAYFVLLVGGWIAYATLRGI